MRSLSSLLIFLGILLALDVYIISVSKHLLTNLSNRTRQLILVIYCLFALFVLLGFILIATTPPNFLSIGFRTYVFSIIMGFTICKFIACSFFIIDDVRRLLQWLYSKFALLFSKPNTDLGAPKISRSSFLSWLGIMAGGSLFTTLLYGFSNKYNFQTKTVDISFDNLPKAFNGLKAVHFSDMHSGSFINKEKIKKGVELIINEKPDIVFFTGDIVNDFAEEMDDYIDLFQQIKAPLGVYATTGNHDYGIYRIERDKTKEERISIINANRDKIYNLYTKLGWIPLFNQNKILEKDGDKIAIIGVENWSAKKHFPSFGNLAKANENTSDIPFKILLSHDPSHWMAQIVKNSTIKFNGHTENIFTGEKNISWPELENYENIYLTLSGHTHGMQFGIEIPGIKWSPVKYQYKQWAGLYQEAKQFLYVNRGFGCLGYSGRVGIMPEITVINFKSKLV